MIVKVVLCLVAYGAIAQAKDYVQIPPEVLPVLGDKAFTCLATSNLDQTAVPKLLAGEIEDTPQARKFIHCFTSSTGYADQYGHFKEDKMMKLIGNHRNKDKYKQVLKTCNKSQGRDNEDTIFKTVSCFSQNSPISFTL